MKKNKLHIAIIKTQLRLLLLILVFTLANTSSKILAQVFPVSLTTQLTPPFTGYLPDYSAVGSNKLNLLLLFNDFTKPAYNVKLKIKITGQGITIESKPYYFEGPFLVEPGVPLQISGSDLGGLLNSNNLDFSGITKVQYEQRKVLPEGLYSVCVTAYDNNSPTNVVVSNESCSYGMMILSDPPYLNLPSCGSSVNLINPQQVTFTWTPINLASPNSASQTEYQFELYEVRPTGQNPNNIVQSLPPIYTETTISTSINYGITEPPLINAMEYVWRVKAVDLSGRDVFKNEGYSQICTFTWGSSYAGANLGINLTGVALTHRQIKCNWDSLNLYNNYKLEFKKVNGTANWFPMTTSNARIKINSLESNTDYLIHVTGQLPDGSWGPQSNEITVHTPPTPVYNCGDAATPVNMQNFTPLTQGADFQIWEIGQFEVLVTGLENYQSTTGQYTGKGRVVLGFAGTISFPVTFTNVTVSSDFVVVNGKIDVRSKGIDNWLSQQNVGNQYVYDESYIFNGCIDSVYTNSNNQVMVVDCSGNVTTLPSNYDGGLLIQDSNGNQWVVSNNGSVTSVNNTTLPLTTIALTNDELDVLTKALEIIRQEYSSAKMTQLEQDLNSKETSYDTQLNAQGSITPISTIQSDGFGGIAGIQSFTPTANAKGSLYKKAELEYNVGKIARIFVRATNTTTEYNFIGQYLVVNGKQYKQFVAEGLTSNRTKDQIAVDVAQLGIKVLMKAVATKKMNED